MAEEKETKASKEPTRSEMLKKAFPQGEKVKFSDKVKCKVLKDTATGLREGDEIEIHPSTAKQFELRKIVEILK